MKNIIKIGVNNKKCKCGKNHRTIGTQHACYARLIKRADDSRDSYDAIIGWTQKKADGTAKFILSARDIIALFSDSMEREYVDFDRKGRGDALNHDLYGYDPNQGVAVIQARHAFRRHKNDFMGTHKTYFLCGKNEITGESFRHPVSASAIHGAIRTGAKSAGIVRAAQKWMWQVTDKQLDNSVRQGDLLLVPERGEPKGDYVGHMMVLGGSHEVNASEILINGKIYAKNPQLTHKKGQHAPVAVNGWVSVRVARDAPAWNFAVRIGD